MRLSTTFSIHTTVHQFINAAQNVIIFISNMISTYYYFKIVGFRPWYAEGGGGVSWAMTSGIKKMGGGLNLI